MAQRSASTRSSPRFGLPAPKRRLAEPTFTRGRRTATFLMGTLGPTLFRIRGDGWYCCCQAFVSFLALPSVGQARLESAGQPASFWRARKLGTSSKLWDCFEKDVWGQLGGRSRCVSESLELTKAVETVRHDPVVVFIHQSDQRSFPSVERRNVRLFCPETCTHVNGQPITWPKVAFLPNLTICS